MGAVHHNKATESEHPNWLAASELVRELAKLGKRKVFERGVRIIAEGEQAGPMYIVQSGLLRAYSVGYMGREVTYGQYGPGDYVGEMSLDGGRRSASVDVTHTAVCHLVTRTQVRSFIAEHPEFAFELLSRVISRARVASLDFKHTATQDVYGRFRHWVNSCAKPLPAPAQTPAAQLPQYTRSIAPKPKQIDVATEIGCSREMISRVLSSLERGGYVQVSKDGWRITQELPHAW